jgi:nucleoside-diphosphate-sugar epimerase
MNVLVAGGAGYIGAILVPIFLRNGFQVTVLDNLIYGQAPLLDCCSDPNFEFIRGDICDFGLVNSLLPKFDVFVPLAAIVGAPACNRNTMLTRLVNYDAHMNMIRNLSTEQRVIFPTTNSGYGVGQIDVECTEESSLQPISEYGRTKVEIEKAFLDKGSAVTLRLATVFGMSPRMRMDLLVNDFVFRATTDRALVLFEEHFRRNYIHVRDVAKTFLFGMDHYERMKGEPYNVGLSSANLSKRELAEKIKQHVPELSIQTAEIGEDPDKRDYIVSNKKIEQLGWCPDHSLDDGIDELVKGYRILRPNIFVNV